MKMKKTNVTGFLYLKNDEGVSPVVGVMLMLVVTIIIAAVVTAFAGGLTETSTTSPVATLKITMFAGSDTNVTIENLGGNTLSTQDLQIITTYTVPDKWGTQTLTNAGRIIKHTIDGSLAPIAENDIQNETIIGDQYPWSPQVTNNADIISTRTADQTFGTVLLAPGTSIVFNRDYFLGFDTSKKSNKGDYGLNEHSVVHVTIIHTPSERVIYDQDVILSW